MSTITTKTLRSVRRHRNTALSTSPSPSASSSTTTPEPPSSSSSDTERSERPAVRSARCNRSERTERTERSNRTSSMRPTTTASSRRHHDGRAPVVVDLPSGGRLNPAARTPMLPTTSVMEAERRMRRLHTISTIENTDPDAGMIIRRSSSRSRDQMVPLRIPHRGIASSRPAAVDSDSDTELDAVDGLLNPRRLGAADPWRWSRSHRSCEVVISGPTNCTAFFHPNWSKGTAGVRGTKVLNNGRHYWEIHLTNRIFGTSMMFGIGTDRTKLHADSFTNLLGLDANSWGLSHKGIVWHNGTGVRYTKCFKENLATTIGLLFDGIDGTLTYYKDGICLGVAFRELDKIQSPIYPIVSSTAAKTEMVLGQTRREFVSLQDRCRAEICKRIRDNRDLKRLQKQSNVPPLIVRYLAEAINQYANL